MTRRRNRPTSMPDYSWDHSLVNRDSIRPPKEDMVKVYYQAQSLVSQINQYLAKADKAFRFTLSKQIRDYASEILFNVRFANDEDLGSEMRAGFQKSAWDYCRKVSCLLPVLYKNHLISEGQMADLELSLEDMSETLSHWVSSDKSRIKKILKEDGLL